jgi:hypothetical protein
MHIIILRCWWDLYSSSIPCDQITKVEEAVMHMVGAHGSVCTFIYFLSIQLTTMGSINVYWSMNVLLQSCFSCNSLNHTYFIKIGLSQHMKKNSTSYPFQTDVRMTLILPWNLSHQQRKICQPNSNCPCLCYIYARHSSSCISLFISWKNRNSEPVS